MPDQAFNEDRLARITRAWLQNQRPSTETLRDFERDLEDVLSERPRRTLHASYLSPE